MRASIRLTCGVAAAALAFLWGPQAGAVTLRSVGLTQVPSSCNGVVAGEAFYQSTFAFGYNGGKVMFSSRPDGQGPTKVGDTFAISVQRPDGSGASTILHYADSLPRAPLDLANLFVAGDNVVTITLSSDQGGCASSSALWLSNQS